MQSPTSIFCLLARQSRFCPCFLLTCWCQVKTQKLLDHFEKSFSCCRCCCCYKPRKHLPSILSFSQMTSRESRNRARGCRILIVVFFLYFPEVCQNFIWFKFLWLFIVSHFCSRDGRDTMGLSYFSGKKTTTNSRPWSVGLPFSIPFAWRWQNNLVQAMSWWLSTETSYSILQFNITFSFGLQEWKAIWIIQENMGQR